jgi:hypothetical protein
MNTEMSQPKLPFADAMHQLNAGDRGHSIAELLEGFCHASRHLGAGGNTGSAPYDCR